MRTQGTEFSFLDTTQAFGIIYIPPPVGGGIKLMKHQDSLKRLRTIEGHIHGVSRMVDEGAYCIDIIRQIQAVQAALNKVSNQILEEHLHSCLITVVRGEDPDERERVLREISDVFDAANKT